MRKELTTTFGFILSLISLFACNAEVEGPEGSVNITPAAIVRGIYTPQQNTCKNDNSELAIIQDVTTLLFKGGFDYLAASPDEFDGFVKESGEVEFILEEGSVSLTCTASLIDAVLLGTCSGSETCSFAFRKKSTE